jgi:arginyl-tRNA synthetase
MLDYLESALGRVIRGLANGDLPADFQLEFEQPNNPEHGDLSTNAALKLARLLKKSPRVIAEDVVARLRQLPLDEDRIESVEIAGAGFINFRFSDRYLHLALAEILTQGEAFGRTSGGAGKRVLVEYVSANPTGPLTVGHGRNAVLGDTIANLFASCGYDVTREYYFNDAGRQMRILGESVKARYEALARPGGPTRLIEAGEGHVVVPESFPEDGYLGDYIVDIARGLYDQHGDGLLSTEGAEPFQKAAQEAIFKEIDATLARLGIRMDEHFNEHSLYTSGKVWETVDALREKGYVYDKDGAIWFETTRLGKDKDTVLVKSTGEPTYRLPDIAYHVAKLERGFDLAIDVFGADHIATYPDVLDGVRLLGYDPSRIDVVIYQFVTLVRNGQPVKMSTRKATYETLDDLMDEVGEDVTRFFFLMRSSNTHLEFDLDLAKEASEKNPVFYLQYAHARICSILRKAAEVGFGFDATTDLTLLRDQSEIALTKSLLRLPDVLTNATATREPHRVATYLREVAVAFSQFYQHCRIIGEERTLATARMALAMATRTVLRNGLAVLGVGAPEQM